MAELSNFLPVFKVCYIQLFHNFDTLNLYEIIAIQNNPFAHRQLDIQTVSTKKSDRNIYPKAIFREVKVASYSENLSIRTEIQALSEPSQECHQADRSVSSGSPQPLLSSLCLSGFEGHPWVS